MNAAPDPATATGAPPQRGRGPMVALALLLLAIVVVVALLFSRSNWWDHSDSPAPVEDVAAAPIAFTPPVATAAPPPLQPIAALPDTGISQAETAAREAALSSRIAALETRLANIDLRASAASGNAARAEGLLVAFAARRALDRGLGLGYIEQQLRERFAEGQPRAVALVIRAARAPVTLEQLRIGFEELAPDLSTATAGESWWQSLQREAAALVVVQRQNTPSARPVDRIQRARRMLEGGRVDGAMAEVARLPGRARAEPWLDEARRYVEARQALDVIETAAIIEPQRAEQAARLLAQDEANPAPTP